MPGIVAANHVNFTDSHGRKWSYPLARVGSILTTNNATIRWTWDGSNYNDGANVELGGRSAKQLCELLGPGWRLPSVAELLQARDNNAISAAAKVNHPRWSSNETGGNGATTVYWPGGSTSDYGASSPFLISCVKD